MKTEEHVKFPYLEAALKPSLFSELYLTEGFSDKNAVFVMDTCKKYLPEKKVVGVDLLLRNLVMESFAFNVGQGDNHGSAYPHAFIAKLEDKFSAEISDELILDILEWACGITDHELVIWKKGKEEEYFFQSAKNPKEFISYETMAKLAKEALDSKLENVFINFRSFILYEIPSSAWTQILNQEETIAKYI